MKLIFDYKFRFHTSKMNEICLHCHLLYFSSIVLSFGQCVPCVHVTKFGLSTDYLPLLFHVVIEWPLAAQFSVIVATGTFQKRYMHSPFANFTLLQLTYKHNGICCGLFFCCFWIWVDFDIGTVKSRFRDIRFSYNLWFSGYFAKAHSSIFYI